MDELILKSHDFDDALKRLKELSEREKTDLDLKKVDTSKDVGEWFSDFFQGMGIGAKHIVTGSELNELTSQIQKHIIDLNNGDKKNSDEIIEVYNALVALDKDYIQVFRIQLEGIKETQLGINKAQEDIQKILEGQKKTLVALKKFMQKIDSYAHLKDIDQIWDNCQNLYNNILALSDSIEHMTSYNNENTKEIENLKETLKSTEEQTFNLLNRVNQQIEKLDTVIDFKNELEKNIHLNNIDEMYASLNNATDSLVNISGELDNINGAVSKQRSDIDSLLAFMEELSKFEHLNDINDIWCKSNEQQDNLNELRADLSLNTKGIEEIKKQSNDTFDLVQANKKNIDELHKIKHLCDIDDIWELGETHSNQLSELKKKNEETSSIIQQNKESVNKAITDMIEKNDSLVQILTKKIKYAYILAGGTLGIAIVELIIILLKVM